MACSMFLDFDLIEMMIFYYILNSLLEMIIVCVYQSNSVINYLVFL
jgi:competence protein ComGC